jgi:acetylornithine deacetylase
MRKTMLIDDLARLVAFDTVSHRPLLALASHLAERAEAAGFSVTLYEKPGEPGKVNVVATAGPEDQDGLILSGHMDVVPTENQPWDSDPFLLTERDGNLFGRGTADMKGFIACCLQACERLDLSQLKRQLVLVWTHDEEVGCQGSGFLVQALKKSPRRLPTECLIGEPTDFQVLRMHPGHVTVRIRTDGEAGHSSKPDLGSSAIKAMHRVLGMCERIEHALEQERRLEKELDRPWVAFNVGTISGGEAVNLIPDSCEIVLGYRPLPGDNPQAVYQQIENALESLSLPAGTTATAMLRTLSPAMLTPKGLALQEALSHHACCSELGAASFSTDGGNLAELGIQSLIFGPGSIDVAHKANEYVSIAALEKGAQMVEAVIRDRCLA